MVELPETLLSEVLLALALALADSEAVALVEEGKSTPVGAITIPVSVALDEVAAALAEEDAAEEVTAEEPVPVGIESLADGVEEVVELPPSVIPRPRLRPSPSELVGAEEEGAAAEELVPAGAEALEVAPEELTALEEAELAGAELEA